MVYLSDRKHRWLDSREQCCISQDKFRRDTLENVFSTESDLYASAFDDDDDDQRRRPGALSSQFACSGSDDRVRDGGDVICGSFEDLVESH